MVNMEPKSESSIERNTFWTQCPFCSAKSKYCREYLDRLLRCQICRNVFIAHEMNKGVHPQSLGNDTPTKAGNLRSSKHLKMNNNKQDAFSSSIKGSNKSNVIVLDDEQDLKSSRSPGNLIDISAETLHDYESDEEVRVLSFKPSNIPFRKRKRTSFVCEICEETKLARESFGIKNCSHVYCSDCVVKYVESKLQANITSIGCPVRNCKGSLDPEYCHSILKPDLFEKWGTKLCEDAVIGYQKFYCPFKDCSAMLIDDGAEVVRESECPNCKRLFCAQCKVPWHSGITCAEFKRLNKKNEKDDIMMEKLAYRKHWRKCPWCGIYVEKTGGCTTITCRCGALFDSYCGRMGCTCTEEGRRRARNGETMGFYVFMEEYRRNHIPFGYGYAFNNPMRTLAFEKWRSMSRSERKPYENPEMKPCKIYREPRRRV